MRGHAEVADHLEVRRRHRGAEPHQQVFRREHEGAGANPQKASRSGSNRAQGSLPRCPVNIDTTALLRGRLLELSQLNEALLLALDHTPHAVVLCDGSTTISTMSPRARRILDARDGLACENSHLVADRCRGGHSLALALRRAIAAPPGENSWETLCVLRPSGRADYELLVFPLSPADPLHPRQVRLLIFLSDPEQLPRSSPEVLAALFGLTAREGQVLALLTQGFSGSALAARLSVGGATIKTHLKALFAKTHTSNQAELVGRALRGLGALSVDRQSR